MGGVDGYNLQNSRKDVALSWTNVYEGNLDLSSAVGNRRIFTFG